MNKLKLTQDELTEIADCGVAISHYSKKILSIIKEENDVLKHLAASSIHLAFFMRDINDIKCGVSKKFDDLEYLFLKNCGCKDKKYEP